MLMPWWLTEKTGKQSKGKSYYNASLWCNHTSRNSSSRWMSLRPCLVFISWQLADWIRLCFFYLLTFYFTLTYLIFCKIIFFAACGNWSSDYLIQMIMIRLYDKNDNDQGEEGAVVLANALAQLVHEVGGGTNFFFTFRNSTRWRTTAKPT